LSRIAGGPEAASITGDTITWTQSYPCRDRPFSGEGVLQDDGSMVVRAEAGSCDGPQEMTSRAVRTELSYDEWETG
jgi:hypothetical protein